MDTAYYRLPRAGKSAQELGGHEVARLKTIASVIPEDVNNILDVGCGDGIICNPLKEKFDVVGIDFSREALLHVAGKKLRGAAEHLPFKDNSFDLVLLSDILEHLADDILTEVINQAQKVSKRYILVNVPNKEEMLINTICCPRCNKSFHINWHLRSFDRDKILKIFSELKLQDLKYCGAPRLKLIGLLVRLKRLFIRRSTVPQVFTVCPFCEWTIDKRKEKSGSGASAATANFKKKAFTVFAKIFGQELTEMVLLLRK